MGTDVFYDKPLAVREMDNGTRLELWIMLFNLRLVVVRDNKFHPEYPDVLHEYCYTNPQWAAIAIRYWDGQGDPPLYYKDATEQRINPIYQENHEYEE